MTNFRDQREIECRVQCIRDHLAVIDGLLQVNWDASTLKRDLAENALKKENRKLKQNLDAAERFVCILGEELALKDRCVEQTLGLLEEARDFTKVNP